MNFHEMQDRIERHAKSYRESLHALGRDPSSGAPLPPPNTIVMVGWSWPFSRNYAQLCNAMTEFLYETYLLQWTGLCLHLRAPRTEAAA